MIKNKYYIGQRVKHVKTDCNFVIKYIHYSDWSRGITYATELDGSYYYEADLEPVPEKKTIVLWQWIYTSRDDGTHSEIWASEDYFTNGSHIKTGASKEVEMP